MEASVTCSRTILHEQKPELNIFYYLISILAAGNKFRTSAINEIIFPMVDIFKNLQFCWCSTWAPSRNTVANECNCEFGVFITFSPWDGVQFSLFSAVKSNINSFISMNDDVLVCHVCLRWLLELYLVFHFNAVVIDEINSQNFIAHLCFGCFHGQWCSERNKM